MWLKYSTLGQDKKCCGVSCWSAPRVMLQHACVPNVLPMIQAEMWYTFRLLPLSVGRRLQHCRAWQTRPVSGCQCWPVHRDELGDCLERQTRGEVPKYIRTFVQTRHLHAASVQLVERVQSVFTNAWQYEVESPGCKSGKNAVFSDWIQSFPKSPITAN
jgi:hypothetical protein